MNLNHLYSTDYDITSNDIGVKGHQYIYSNSSMCSRNDLSVTAEHTDLIMDWLKSLLLTETLKMMCVCVGGGGGGKSINLIILKSQLLWHF